MNFFRKVSNRYKFFFEHPTLIKSTFVSILFLFGVLVLNFYAGLYVSRIQSNSVTDLFLSNFPIYNVDGIFVFGSIFFVLFIIIFCLLYPQKASYTIKSISLFIFIRSIFISLTHLGPFPGRLPLDSVFSGFIQGKFSFGADLFFSGHTGLPFLMALIFWKHIYLRYLFIFLSIFFGVVVLLGHIHYSIDVLSAFFITYTIFHINMFLFKKDMEYFDDLKN